MKKTSIIAVLVLFGLVGFGLGVSRADAAVTFVQGTTGSTNAGGGSVIGSLSSMTGSGHTIVALIQWAMTPAGSTSSISSITDSLDNVFTIVTSTLANYTSSTHEGNIYSEIAYATNTPPGFETITVNFKNIMSFASVSIFEITSATLDQTASSTGNSTNPSAGSATTGQNGEFGAAVTIMDDGGGTTGSYTAGSGWTIKQNNGGGVMTYATEYIQQTNAGSLTGNFTNGNTGQWTASMATFKEATFPTITGFRKRQAGAHTFDSGSTTTISCTFDKPPTQGDTVAIGMLWFNGTDQSSTITSVKDANNNSYTVTPSSPEADNGTAAGTVYLAYLLNAPANASNTITTTFGTAFNGAADMYCDDFSVLGGTASFDHDATSSSGGNGQITVPIIPVSGTNELLYAIAGDSTAVTAVNSPWQAGGNAPSFPNVDGSAAAYLIGVSSNTGLDMNVNGSTQEDSMGMSFKFTPANPYHVALRGKGTSSRFVVQVRGGGATGSQISTYVQSTNSTTNSNTSTSLAFSSPNVAGNTIVVGLEIAISGQSPQCHDSQGNTYAVANTLSNVTIGLTDIIAYALNIKAGANTVTCDTFGGTSGTTRISIHEYSGISSFDTATGQNGNDATPTSGNITTAQSNELIFGWAFSAIGNLTAGSGFNERENVNTRTMISEDKLINAAGTNSATWTDTSGNWAAQVAGFKTARSTGVKFR